MGRNSKDFLTVYNKNVIILRYTQTTKQDEACMAITTLLVVGVLVFLLRDKLKVLAVKIIETLKSL